MLYAIFLYRAIAASNGGTAVSQVELATILKKSLKESLEAGISQGVFPGGISMLIQDGKSAVTVAAGTLSAAEDTGLALELQERVDETTIYDMASLTKVMVTLPLLLLSVQEGRLSLTDSISQHLPELETGTDLAVKRKITLLHLLTHTAGLPAWRPYFLHDSGCEAYIRRIAQEAMIGIPGKQVVYSDLGFILLGFILERVWDEPLDELARRLIFQPSGMSSTCYLPLVHPELEKKRIAPMEKGDGFELNLAMQQVVSEEALGLPTAQALSERIASFHWRTGIIHGIVHDCNAYHGLAGISGHAGLFSTCPDTERYMRIWTSAEAPVRIDPLLQRLACRCQTGGLAPMRALGWEAAATGGNLEQLSVGCTGGDCLSEHAFGHTGFTGTSIWRDPFRRATLITLTNRVHPTVSRMMGTWRRSHHNRLFSLITPVAKTRGR
ncbi:beta-lactamase family protein [Brevibacillus ruminantium]|uniref:Beta-lactamase family protein n=1 Tax=Brevibacillus ruminantium TaxID=2950604 RepID=A0ABY4WAW8_9BACL|nr:serine hydrolase domain-containing protein [Brevibacillus ruminantium]USG64326.1 beta-lactamase family protein [Brevibacillus ruminantium]